MEQNPKLVPIPESTTYDSIRRIWNYTIGFLKVKVEDGVETDAILSGLGILVKTSEKYAILTAHHVVKEISKTEHIGLILSYKKENSRLNSKLIEFIDIARGSEESIGPDIALINLPVQIAKNLESRKSFYNLTRCKEMIMTAPPKDNLGIWFSQGFVDERTKTHENQRESAIVKSFCQFSAGGIVDSYEETDGYDYYHFPIDKEFEKFPR